MASTLALAALVIGCGEDASTAGPEAPFALGSRPVLPFPTDELARPEPRFPTGLALSLGPEGTNLGDVDEALFLLGEAFVEGLRRLDGWSTLAPVFAPIAEPAELESARAHFHLVDLDAGRVVPTRVTVIGGETTHGRAMHWLAARPLEPLAPATAHAVVIRRGLTTAAGERFVRSPTFDALWRGRDPGAGDPERITRAEARRSVLQPGLAAAGIAADEVLLADLFTTQSVRGETEALAAALRRLPPPQLERPHVYAELGEDPHGHPYRRPQPHLRALARARFALPTFRRRPEGPLEIPGAGDPPITHEQAEVLVLLPRGEGPFPVVLFHHGLGDTKESALVFADGVLARGLAMVAIDAPLHGARTDRPGNAGTRFLNVVSPAAVADNLRQAQTDQLYAVRVIDALAELDLLGDGTGRLDPSRLFYLGESLGSVVGGVVIGLEPRLEGAALTVGGGTLLEFFDRVLSGFQFDGFPTQLFSSVAQAVLDRGDPSNWAFASKEKQVLLVQAVEDAVIPPAATEALARAMALPHVGPVVRPGEAIPLSPSPALRRGWTQFSPATHALFRDARGATYGPARDQVFHFAGSWADTGTGEIRAE